MPPNVQRGYAAQYGAGEPLAYRSKGCIPVEVLPVPNAYTLLMCKLVERSWPYQTMLENSTSPKLCLLSKKAMSA